VALGVLGAILRPKNGKDKLNQEERKETNLNQFSNYLSEVDKNVSLLSDERKAGREKLLNELKNNLIYKKLVLEKEDSPEYLMTLSVISSSIASINNETFRIDENLAKTLESSKNGEEKLDFAVKVVSLVMPNINGGINSELIEVFNQFKNKYGLYSEKRIMFDMNKNQTNIDKFDLTALFVILDKTNVDYVEALYEAKVLGFTNWANQVDYLTYPFLSIPSEYSKLLLNINPSSKLLPKGINDSFWEKYDPIVKDRALDLIIRKDCSGLQDEFNITADNMDKLQSAGKSASRNIDLMNFLEEQMKELDCH